MSAGGLASTRSIQTVHQRSVVKNGMRDGHGQLLVIAFVAGVDKIIAHGLGRVPVGYHTVRVPVGGGVVTDGSNSGADWSVSQVVLRASVSGTYTIWLF
jgi:hypothetical protein